MPNRRGCDFEGGEELAGQLSVSDPDGRWRIARPAIAAEFLGYGGLEMDLAAHRVKRDGLAIQLGPTEYRLLRHFLEHPGRVFSRQQLLETVWPHSEDIELRTVDVHIRRLRLALGAPDIVRTVRSAGYALDAEGLA